jgi:hypothetical protein
MTGGFSFQLRFRLGRCAFINAHLTLDGKNLRVPPKAFFLPPIPAYPSTPKWLSLRLCTVHTPRQKLLKPSRVNAFSNL